MNGNSFRYNVYYVIEISRKKTQTNLKISSSNYENNF